MPSLKASLSEEEEITLSLKSVFDRVRKENLGVLLQRERVREAVQDACIQRANLLPEANFAINQSRTRFLTTSVSQPVVGITSDFTSEIEGSMPLFDLPKLGNYRSAKMGHRVAKLDYAALVQGILLEGAKAYFLHLRNLERIKVLDANIERSEVLLDLAESQFNAGVATSLDVTRAEVQLAKDRKEKLEHETTTLRSELNLKLILDMDPCVGIKMSPLKEIDEPFVDLQECPLEVALNGRSDYQSAEHVLKRNRIDRKTAGWDQAPKVLFNGSYGCGSKVVMDRRNVGTWTVGMTLSMPIFDGLRMHSNKLKANAIIRAQKHVIKDLRNTIGADILINEQDMKSRYKQIIIAQEQFTLGEKELELSQLQFMEGVASNEAVIDAQTRLTEASDELINSIYLYVLSHINWAYTLGDVQLLVTYGY